MVVPDFILWRQFLLPCPFLKNIFYSFSDNHCNLDNLNPSIHLAILFMVKIVIEGQESANTTLIARVLVLSSRLTGY
jgi:hypothetical protein